MTDNKALAFNIVEIRHEGGVLQFPFLADDAKIQGTAINEAGERIEFNLTINEVEPWAQRHEGIEGKVAKIALPPLNLNILFEEPRFRRNITLGVVCDPYSLFQEAKIAGSEGTIFTKDDVRSAIEGQMIGDYENLSEEDKEAFLNEHWYDFTSKLGDVLAERGNFHIDELVGTETEERIQEFVSNQAQAKFR